MLKKLTTAAGTVLLVSSFALAGQTPQGSTIPISSNPLATPPRS